MKTSHRRIALLTGASIAALGLAAPALAAPHDTLADGTYPGTATTDDTVEICDLATPPGTPCFFGVIDTTGASSLAVINAFPNGEINQNPGAGLAGVMANGGSAENGAIAIATGAAANATASALAIVYQNDFAGTGDADLSIANSGTWLFDAVASAVATAGAADANARVQDALHQEATGADVSLAIVNDGSLSFLASANAAGTASAAASATVQTAISQRGNGDSVTLSLANNSSIDVGAVAVAVATSGIANAAANITNAISQSASATSGDASVVMTNALAGTINIHATATATGDVGALANISGGIRQEAHAGGTITEGLAASAIVPLFVTSTANDAFASMTNAGAITVAANASANDTGTGPATANAQITSAIAQTATATGNAGAFLDNSGSIAINAIANANAATGTAVVGGAALANATVDFAIQQNVNGSGTASASFTNSGTIAVGASAHAFGEFLATANANVDNAFYQIVTAGSTALATFNNGGSISLSAIAGATGGGVAANAFAEYIMEQDVIGTSAAAVISNTGTMSLLASAAAVGTKSASAVATANEALVQDVSGTVASASIVNGGTINVSAIAAATAASGSALAYANVDSAIVQTVNGLSASAVFSNSGTIALNASAVANASTFASATASVSGVQQNVGSGSFAFASAFNSGSIALNATAAANGSSAFASANASGGIAQFVHNAATASAVASNSGTIALNASAVAVATAGLASASASAGSAMSQVAVSVGTGGANLSMTNNGLVSLNAFASASGAGGATTSGGSAQAYANASTALFQEAVFVAGSANLTMTNGGPLNVNAHAVAIGNGTDINPLATATTLTGAASASAYATGMGQEAVFVTGPANLTMTNSGALNVSATATASGVTHAYASASALGAWQFDVATGPSTLTFNNSGSMDVAAVASATAASGSASAYANATGYSGTVGGDVAVAIDNGLSHLNVSATAIAPAGTASATAVGMALRAFASGTGTGALTGSINNAGDINVVANASGATFTTTVAGPPVVTSTGALSNASATGIFVQGGLNNLTITNSGSIAVDAITANGDLVTLTGGNATAYGIRVTTNGTAGAPALTDILTINNSGDIIVRESGDGGASFHRGLAIDVATAPNSTVINLLGGNIYGNIDVKTGDVINVTTARTSFDGIIDPECMPPVFDNAVTSACGQSVLNINTGGELFLRDDPFANVNYDGPSYAFVNTLNIAADGTIVYELPTSSTGGTQLIGTYPQVFADVANLDGTLLVHPNTSNGLFADDYFFDNVIDANTRNGTFATCGLDGTFADSAFLTLTCIYDAANNVDLGLERTPFDAIPGLTHNQASTAFGLECIFDPTLTGGMADVLADIFTFNAADFKVALDQLGGAAYAQYLSSFNSLGVHYNDILAKATDCEVPALAGSSLECRTSPTHMWAQVDFQNRKTDGDIEAGGYDADRWTAILGFDASVGNAAIIGASIGKVTNRLDFSQFNNKVNADGYQVGLYGVFDPGAFYVKALGTYSWFDGDSTRRIDFRPFGGVVNGQLHGDPDVRLWTLGLHGGYRIAMGATSAVTPYLNLDYTSAKLKGFTEFGLVGPELTVYDSTEKRTTLTGGVKWAGDIGGVVPEVDLGYRYQFGDRRSNFRAAFLGDAACAFDIISENEKRGAFLAGLSLGGKAGPVDVRVSYQGLFNGQSTSHGGNFKIVLPFGGHAAPPPPPPPEPVVAPPPPPPPPVEVAPPPPPPPPPPAPSGERG